MKVSIALIAAAIAVGTAAAKECNSGCCIKVPNGYSVEGDSVTDLGNNIRALEAGSLYLLKDGQRQATFKVTKNHHCKAISHRKNAHFTSSGRTAVKGDSLVGKGVFEFHNSSNQDKHFEYKTDRTEKGETFSGGRNTVHNGNFDYEGQHQTYSKDAKDKHVDVKQKSSEWSTNDGRNERYGNENGNSVGGYFNSKGGDKKSFEKNIDENHKWGKGHSRGGAVTFGKGQDGETTAYNYDQGSQGGKTWNHEHQKGTHEAEHYSQGAGGIVGGYNGYDAQGYLRSGKKNSGHYESSKDTGNKFHKSWNKGNGVEHDNWGYPTGSGTRDAGNIKGGHRHTESTEADRYERANNGIGGHAGPDGIHGGYHSNEQSGQRYRHDEKDESNLNYARQKSYKGSHGSGRQWEAGSSSSSSESSEERTSQSSNDQNGTINKGK